MNGGNAGDFDGGCRVRRCHLNGKNAGADKQRKIGGKVAEIEFFEVGNHAENGHLSADIVTTAEKRYTEHHQRKRQREGFFSKSASAKPRNVR